MTYPYPKYNVYRLKLRCALFPWLRARHQHHTAYGGRELLWWDLLPLSREAHWVIHGLLGGSIWMKQAVTRQNRMAKRLPCSWLWRYPNPLQRLTHLWCRVIGWLFNQI